MVDNRDNPTCRHYQHVFNTFSIHFQYICHNGWNVKKNSKAGLTCSVGAALLYDKLFLFDSFGIRGEPFVHQLHQPACEAREFCGFRDRGLARTRSPCLLDEFGKEVFSGPNPHTYVPSAHTRLAMYAPLRSMVCVSRRSVPYLKCSVQNQFISRLPNESCAPTFACQSSWRQARRSCRPG